MIITAFYFLSIQMFDYLITYFKNPNKDTEYLIIISSLLIGGRLFSIILSRQYSNYEANIANESMQTLIVYIFNKLFKTSPSISYEGYKSSHGEIMNYIQVDVIKLGYMLMACPKLFIYPIQICVFLYFLFYYLGFAFLFGIIVFVFCGVMNYFLYSGYGNQQENLMKKKDLRMKLNSEIFENLKLLKMYAWETDFMKKVL